MVSSEAKMDFDAPGKVTGEFLTIGDERHYVIRNVDKLPPFFISVVSSGDHWFFVSSNGGLTAGRVAPENALFPYIPVDKIHDAAPHTGSTTIVRLQTANGRQAWEPFNREHDGRYNVSRNLYKSVAGDKVCFEEVNLDLQLAFRYTWTTSDRFGFVRQCELTNLGMRRVSGELLDGLQNILPAGTPLGVQLSASNLVDAYKWTELDAASGMAIYALYSGISDRAEPFESLRANTVFCLGLPDRTVLLSSEQLGAFRAGHDVQQEDHKRGIRGAFFVHSSFELERQETEQWQLVADVEQTQSKVVALMRALGNHQSVAESVAKSIADGADTLLRIMAATDALQVTAEERVVAHHYANVLFNNLRGGIFDNQYEVTTRDFADTVQSFNRETFEANATFLRGLPEKLDYDALLALVRDQRDPDLERLCFEYLPIRFGRRHGDPSRPWNRFSIKLECEHGGRLLSYEGNWRDIFQNWEALTFSYPEFIENVIAKFVNASTVDGYNPYRISKQGIDWEVEDPEDPWTYIGYWGDHQIIYLLKFLEMSARFHPARLHKLLRKDIFSYANVPYRIKPLDALLKNPKNTVEFDYGLAARIEDRVAAMGADGKLVCDPEGRVYRTNLLEKLLVPVLSKLGNLVVDGGIWLNTQRPEWNDANNALVGHGLSMVTLFYLRRYLAFLENLLATDEAPVELSCEVAQWLDDTGVALENARRDLDGTRASRPQRYEIMVELGRAASKYRQSVYRDVPFSGRESQPVEKIKALIADAMALLEHSILANRRDDGLYHAYNLLSIDGETAGVETLYPMLEGQVAALSAGFVGADEACELLQALFESDIYRPDQRSFMLYPDRALRRFLEKNCIPDEAVEQIPVFRKMLDEGDKRLICRDLEKTCRFNADLVGMEALERRLDELAGEYGDALRKDRQAIRSLFESVFGHRTFTGRSGGMFGFEGLGCIYWHMVSKLLLAIQENFFAAVDKAENPARIGRLGQYYYQVRAGLGFNKTPAEYGAFPTDPYSHTPKHAGAQQPGMTGQVKEEVLTRFGELGIRVEQGRVRFLPSLLRSREFLPEAKVFDYVPISGKRKQLQVPAGALAITWCQVPILYELDEGGESSLTVHYANGEDRTSPELALSIEQSAAIFRRNGEIRQITVRLTPDKLFDHSRARQY